MSTFKIAAVFSNNMVLQRDKNINIWGSANKNDKITVSISNNTISTIAIEGKWQAILPSMSAGGPYILTVSDGINTKTFNNVMIGEVWLAGGQSNMELELQNSLNGKEVLANIKNVNVRFYYTQKNSYLNDEFYRNEENTSWSECTPTTAGTWSAVGYYYAKRLSEELGVTVGIIGCNWGGTSASAWMSKETLEKDIDTKTYIDEYEKAMEGKTFEQYEEELKDYESWYKQWQEKVGECYAKDSNISWSDVIEFSGESRWPEPLGPKSPYRPGGLYETMLKRVMPYSLRGFIYYQGESDDHKPKIYYKLFTKMIDQWRTDWEDDELSFLFVQLPMFKNKDDPDYKHWCLIREAQMKAHKTIKNTGIAVILDCGELNNIHPLNKKTVGERLALQAYKHTYNKNTQAYGPIYKSINYINGGIEISFEHIDGGFIVKGEKADGFEIAGEDKKFVKADIKINNEKIFISSMDISNPKYARYAWTNFSGITLFNKINIPLAPFRTSKNDE